MSKKIGIVTMYYNSVNYGGLLQAYALCKVLNKYEGVNAEQIQYNDRRLKYKVIGFVRECRYKLKNVKLYSKHGFSFSINNKKRKNKILKFAYEYIPHTKKVFTKKNIENVNCDFDSFVCGSDQVWCSRDGIYYLNFVKNKEKFAYAGSTGKSSYKEEEKALYKKLLSDFNAVSAREEDLSKLLSEELNRNVQWVLDPTLLLDKSDWDEICTDRIIPEEYVFCYFLGSDESHRNLAKEYAEANNLKLVTLPHLQQKLTKNDIAFGDNKLYEIDPKDFISLIKHANCVFTDSFHASVFSGIYEKKFFVFERGGHRGMSSRIYTLAELFGCHSHFCNGEDKMAVDYFNKTAPSYDKQNYHVYHEKSMRFIEEQILGESIDEK